MEDKKYSLRVDIVAKLGTTLTNEEMLMKATIIWNRHSYEAYGRGFALEDAQDKAIKAVMKLLK